MSKILNGSLNLEKLVHAKIKTKKGNPAIVIPLDKNFLIAGKKGTYLNLTVFINDEKDDYGNIASIKQNGAIKDKKWSELSEEEKTKIKNLPYLGNLAMKEDDTSTAYDNAETVEDASYDDIPF